MPRIKLRKDPPVKVRDIMTTDVACCAPGDSLEHAARLMWERDCGVVPVVDGSRVVGMVTDRDCCMAAFTKGRRLDEIPVDEVMARQVKSCVPDDKLDQIERQLRQFQIRRMPVISAGKLVGIISLNDLALAAERGQEAPEELAGTLATISQHRHRPVAAE